MQSFNVHEAKTRFSELLDRALRGEEVIIARAGRPLVRLVPVEELALRTPGLARGSVGEAFFEPLPEADLAAWEGEG
jgi:prevent-host-death family protein